MSKQDIIAQDLVKKIRHGLYQPGTFLPSEHQLTLLYGTSRETIRDALAQLNALGLIQKMKGKGSVVLDSHKFAFPISGITSFQELNQKLGLHARTKVLSVTPNTQIPAYFIEHGVTAKQPNTYVERLRIIDNEPVVIDRDYLLNPPISTITPAIAANSLYDYIENTLKLEISYATKEITVESASDKIAHQFHLTKKSLVVVVRSMSFLADTTLFQLTESYHRPDKFKFNDFARRQKLNFN